MFMTDEMTLLLIMSSAGFQRLLTFRACWSKWYWWPQIMQNEDVTQTWPSESSHQLYAQDCSVTLAYITSHISDIYHQPQCTLALTHITSHMWPWHWHISPATCNPGIDTYQQPHVTLALKHITLMPQDDVASLLFSFECIFQFFHLIQWALHFMMR